MVDVSIIDGISIVSGIISIILAIVAIWFALRSEKGSQENYDRTKDVLGDINKKSAVIENTVSTAQKQLLDTVTKILEETAIPQKVTQDEQMGAVMLQLLAQDPKSFENLMKTMAPYMQPNEK